MANIVSDDDSDDEKHQHHHHRTSLDSPYDLEDFSDDEFMGKAKNGTLELSRALRNVDETLDRLVDIIQMGENLDYCFRIVDGLPRNYYQMTCIVNAFQYYKQLGRQWKELHLMIAEGHQPKAFSLSILKEAPGLFRDIHLSGRRNAQPKQLLLTEEVAMVLRRGLQEGKLDNISIQHMRLDREASYIVLSQGMRRSSTLQGLNLFQTRLEKEAIGNLVTGLQETKTLKRLWIRGGTDDPALALSDANLARIIVALSGCSSLTSLWLVSHAHSTATVDALQTLLGRPSCRLAHLSLSRKIDNVCGKLDIGPLLEGFKKARCCLTSLCLNENGLDHQDLAKIWETIDGGYCPMLESIELRMNEISTLPLVCSHQEDQKPRLRSCLRSLVLSMNPVLTAKDCMENRRNLLQMIQCHPRIDFVCHGFEQYMLHSPEIGAMLDLNKVGRVLLLLPTTLCPLSVWPLVLARAIRKLRWYYPSRRITALYSLVRGIFSQTGIYSTVPVGNPSKRYTFAASEEHN